MKLPDKHTYGPVPDAFKASLRLALRTEAAATPVRFSRKRTVLLVALLLIALAATHRAGLLAFVDKWSSQGGNVPALTPLAAENDTPLLQALFDDLVVTVTEAAGDGSECYFATTIALRPGVKGRLVDRDTILNDGTDAPVVTPDGVPVYYVQHVMMAGESYANTTDSIVNEDGSLSIMNAATLLADADTAQMTCIVRYVKAASGAMPDAAGASQKALPFDLPLPPSGEVRSLAAPVALDALGMQIEGLSMRNTPEGYRCFVYFTYQGGAPVAYRLPSNTGDGVQFRLLDESGAVLAEQMGFDWRGGTRFVATRALSADALPDAVTLQIYDAADGQTLRSQAIPLTDAPTDEALRTAYERQPPNAPDRRDMYFAWNLDEAWTGPAYVLPANGGTAPLYADPDDPASHIGDYYGGVLAEPNVHYKEWTSVRIGAWPYATLGYMKTADLTQAHAPGVPVAAVASANGTFTEVRLAPQNGVVAARLDTGAAVLILGMQDGWLHVATLADGAARVLGFMPADEAAPTDETAAIPAYGMPY